jgi:hypothetical protein
MAIQVVPWTAQPQKPSTAEKFSDLIQAGTKLYSEYEEGKKAAEQLSLEKEALHNLGESLGLKDLERYDPETRKQVIGEALKGKRQQDILKNVGSYFEQSEEDVNHQFYDQKPKPKGILKPEFEKEVPPKKTKPKSDLSKQLIPEDVIVKTALVNDAAANKMQKHNDNIREEIRHREKMEFEETKEERKSKQHEKEFFHSESKKYDETLNDQAIAAEKKNRALESQLKLAHKLGKWDRVVSALAGQSKWGSLLKSTSAQEFDSYALPQMEGLRQVLGGVLSDSDIRLIMQKVVTSDKTPEANEKIAKYLMSENNLLIAKKQIGDELKRNNGGYRPANYDSEINRIFNERYGKQIQQEYQDLMSLPDDPKKLNQIGRRVVPPNTPISDETLDMYLSITGGDPVLTKQYLEEDGYDISR